MDLGGGYRLGRASDRPRYRAWKQETVIGRETAVIGESSGFAPVNALEGSGSTWRYAALSQWHVANWGFFIASG